MIGLLEPMKTSSIPVLLQLSAPVVKIVSGEQGPGVCGGAGSGWCTRLLQPSGGGEGPEGPCPFPPPWLLRARYKAVLALIWLLREQTLYLF